MWVCGGGGVGVCVCGGWGCVCVDKGVWVSFFHLKNIGPTHFFFVIFRRILMLTKKGPEIITACPNKNLTIF